MGTIVHLDDNEEILVSVEKFYNQLDIGLDFKGCTTKEEFKDVVNNEGIELRCIIFDLLSEEPDKEELHSEDAEFLDFIESSFANYNIPIFIYSGYLEAIEGKFDEYGTVFKVDKDQKEGIKKVFDKISLFHDSGFLEIFGPGGKLEKELHKELHKAFVSQFTNNSQIEDIIKLISKSTDEKTFPNRVEKVFKRIAISSLLSGLKAPEADESGNVKKPEFSNPVEHYLQRISPFSYWTGDIFKHKSQNKYLLILTPRCNVASNKFEDLLVCKVDTDAFPKDTSNREKRDEIGYALTDKPEIAGYNRYLAPSPLFPGGEVILSSYEMIKKSELAENYDRVITLSDELTNEILGKFGSYFFRSGITPWDKDETLAHIKTQKEDAKE